jgi:hypothetical protein
MRKFRKDLQMRKCMVILVFDTSVLPNIQKSFFHFSKHSGFMDRPECFVKSLLVPFGVRFMHLTVKLRFNIHQDNIIIIIIILLLCYFILVHRSIPINYYSWLYSTKNFLGGKVNNSIFDLTVKPLKLARSPCV